MLPLTLARTPKTSTSPSRVQISAVGIAVLLICLAARTAGTARLNHALPRSSGRSLDCICCLPFVWPSNGREPRCCDSGAISGCAGRGFS
jgi:hypothetical protein